MTRWPLLLALGLAACGRPTVPSPGTPGASFPHADGYVEGGHGVDALADGEACLSCHALAANEEGSGAPGCLSCHADYPHPEGFFAGAVHGAAWEGDAATCAGCHGADGRTAPAALDAARCVSCHSTYPHASGWSDGGAHGAAVLQRGGAGAGATCHGADGSAGPSSGDCSTCHDYPHASGWSDPDAHGEAWHAGGDGCASCHDGSADAAAVSCSSCHDVFPHSAGWPAGHIPLVQSRGEASCAACHEPGTPTAPALPVSCGASCHSEESR